LRSPDFNGLVPLIGAIDEVKFKRPVRPGDQLITEVELLWVRLGAKVGRIRCVASVGDEVAASMELTFKLRAPAEGQGS
jgi:3-hydroxymyristoyl/3-hydroxydecanoyl-(acyl carrier protein) dehydratase